MNTLTYGSLFSGIGGIDLGLDRAGMQCKWQVEIDEYATKVLAKHWPDVARFRDIRDCGADNLTSVDLICGGFPCQPHSIAGKRNASTDERDLWGEFYRIICEIRPSWVLAENVPGLLSSENGRFFGRILSDLATSGYDAQWQTLSAFAFGAPHLRERTFIVAYHRSQRVQGLWTQKVQRVKAFSWCQDVRSIEDLRDRPNLPPSLIWGNRNGIPSYMDRIRGLGNAVVPQIAEYIGNCIMNYHQQNVSLVESVG